MIKEQMINFYDSKSAANAYIIGFCFQGILYQAQVANINAEWLTVEKASRHQGDNLRLRLRQSVRAELAKTATAIGTTESLLDSKYNKGEKFEKLVTESFHQEWHKDNIPFYVQGDIEVNGIQIQIKLDGATLINSKQMERMER